MTTAHYELSHLEALEAEAVHIFREVAAEFERPVLLFSGGKDSIVMLHLAEKAFWPARVPFPVMHVDTGHNFAEVLAFRDSMVEQVGACLVVNPGSLGESRDRLHPRDVSYAVLDTTSLEVDDVVDRIEALVHERTPA